MAKTENQRLADALAGVLVSHVAPAGGPALGHWLKDAGCIIHPNTLDKILNGTRRPQRRTVEKILDGVQASQVERQMVWTAWEAAQGRTRKLATVSVLAALGGAKQVDVGRLEETVTWRFLIGAGDAEDEVTEIRRTLVGPEPMTLASCGPGQFGSPGFALEDLPSLDFRVRCFRLENGQPKDRIATALHVVTIAPEKRQQRLAIQFSGTQSGDRILWETRYRWPGLWHSLREGGESSGRLSMNSHENPKVTTASVEIVADQETFPDLTLIPASATAEVKKSVRDGQLWLRWSQGPLPTVLEFKVRSATRRKP